MGTVIALKFRTSREHSKGGLQNIHPQHFSGYLCFSPVVDLLLRLLLASFFVSLS